MEQDLIEHAQADIYKLSELLKAIATECTCGHKAPPYFTRHKWKTDLELLRDRVNTCLKLVAALDHKPRIHSQGVVSHGNK